MKIFANFKFKHRVSQYEYNTHIHMYIQNTHVYKITDT